MDRGGPALNMASAATAALDRHRAHMIPSEHEWDPAGGADAVVCRQAWVAPSRDGRTRTPGGSAPTRAPDAPYPACARERGARNEACTYVSLF
jgi:hypothetical protein